LQELAHLQCLSLLIILLSRAAEREAVKTAAEAEREVCDAPSRQQVDRARLKVRYLYLARQIMLSQLEPADLELATRQGIRVTIQYSRPLPRQKADKEVWARPTEETADQAEAAAAERPLREEQQTRTRDFLEAQVKCRSLLAEQEAELVRSAQTDRELRQVLTAERAERRALPDRASITQEAAVAA
jgi:hypothetical protein